MFKKKSIKASAQALQVLQSGKVVLQSVSHTYLMLAAKLDNVPDGYALDEATMTWIIPPKSPVEKPS